MSDHLARLVKSCAWHTAWHARASSGARVSHGEGAKQGCQTCFERQSLFFLIQKLTTLNFPQKSFCTILFFIWMFCVENRSIKWKFLLCVEFLLAMLGSSLSSANHRAETHRINWWRHLFLNEPSEPCSKHSGKKLGHLKRYNKTSFAFYLLVRFGTFSHFDYKSKIWQVVKQQQRPV
jgi:hypothetical protein